MKFFLNYVKEAGNAISSSKNNLFVDVFVHAVIARPQLEVRNTEHGDIQTDGVELGVRCDATFRLRSSDRVPHLATAEAFTLGKVAQNHAVSAVTPETAPNER